MKKITVFSLFLLPIMAYADSSHHHGAQMVQTEKTSQGAALGLAASNHHFIPSNDFQASIAIGGFDDRSAISFAGAKSVGKDGVLVSGSVGLEEGEIGYGAGISMRFK